MAASVAQTTTPSLVAVALIIRSRDGPRFVFHYPPHPTTLEHQKDLLRGTELDEESRGYETDTEDEDDDLDQDLGEHFPVILDAEGDEHFDTLDGTHVVPWEHLFDFPTTDLESILTPSKAYHKNKFELSLSRLTFLSYPEHIREDGLWKKRKPKRTKKVKKQGSESIYSELKADDEVTGDDETQNGDDRLDDGDEHGGMTMFNVVFILGSSKGETHDRNYEIYEHIVKKFNKALNHAQASSDYVWKESEMILAMKEKARDARRPMSWLWAQIILKSTLAASIRDVFIAISNNKIATVHFATTPSLDLSLQIPIPSFLTSIPTMRDVGIPGLLLTSANPFIDEEGDEHPTLNKHFALLLLYEESKIIGEIQADDTDLSTPLIQCIRFCKPDSSFQQVAQKDSIELGSLLTLAQHLIYWRKAIAIPPLHGRDTYIVSPNCDMRKLRVANITWKKSFPFAPSLPSFLAALSAAPRPYKTFAPSKNHRPTYLDMLAWLIRGGWVTRLSHFGWILVWPEIIYEVEYQLKAEAIEKAKKGAKSQSGSSTDSTEGSATDKQYGSSFDEPLTTAQVAENARLERLAERNAKIALEEAAAFTKMVIPLATDEVSCNNATHLKDISPYVIKDPHRIDNKESLYIAAIGKRIKDPKAKECWSKFTKYFNGNEAMESIALRENMKRKETWNTLIAYQDHLLICRHW